MKHDSCESEMKGSCENKIIGVEQEKQLVERIRKTISTIKLNLDSLERAANLEQADRIRQSKILDSNLTIIY